MKRGAYLVNTARGKICDPDAVAQACASGQLAGDAGDVWFPQPAPKDHPWRTMRNNGMTPHTSGTSLSAQARYAAGVREILECWFDGRPLREQYLIVDAGKLAVPEPIPTAQATLLAARMKPRASRPVNLQSSLVDSARGRNVRERREGQQLRRRISLVKLRALR